MTPNTTINLTPADLAAIAKYHYGNSLKAFIKDAWHFHHPKTAFVDNWHIDAMCDHLEAQSRGEIQRLIINVPPGSLKSLGAGVYWPAWDWINRPETQIVSMAASERLSFRDSQRMRWLVEGKWYQSFNPIEMLTDANAAGKFVNSKMGFRWSVPFTKVTGFRGDRIIIDDPISAKDALSDAKRSEVNETFWSNVITRLNDPATSTATIIMQRLHEDDLIGNILSLSPDRWEKLILPMERTSYHHVTKIGFSDPREEGEPLFPARWSAEDIEEFKLKPYDWASQHQQDPVPGEDGLFKREWFDNSLYEKDNLPKDLVYYLATDHAVDEEDRHDYNVCLVLALDKNKDIYVIDAFRERCSLPAGMGIAADDNGKLGIASKGALALARKYRPHRWFAESDNNFKGIQGLVKETMRSSGVHVPLELVSPHGSNKKVKASALQGYASVGKVHFEKGSRFYTEALQEFLKFPVGKHDDIVDALALFCRAINGAHPAIVSPVDIRGEVKDGYQRRREQGDQRQKGFF